MRDGITGGPATADEFSRDLQLQAAIPDEGAADIGLPDDSVPALDPEGAPAPGIAAGLEPGLTELFACPAVSGSPSHIPDPWLIDAAMPPERAAEQTLHLLQPATGSFEAPEDHIGISGFARDPSTGSSTPFSLTSDFGTGSHPSAIGTPAAATLHRADGAAALGTNGDLASGDRDSGGDARAAGQVNAVMHDAVMDSTNGTPTGNPYIDTLISGYKWTGGPIYYAFATGDPYGDLGTGNWDNGVAYSGQSWEDYEKQAFYTVVGLYESVSNIDFVETTNVYDANILWFQGDDNALSGLLGMHDFPDGDVHDGGQVAYGQFNNDSEWWNADTLQPGGDAFFTVIHELGHGVGLAHPHDGYNGNEVFPGLSLPTSNSDDSDDIGKYGLNQGPYTVMSYNAHLSGSPAAGADYGEQVGFGAFDIYALQLLYGANTTYHTGDDTYALPSANVAGTGWTAIWDAGGNDTIDGSAATASLKINLNDAEIDTGPNSAGYLSQVTGIAGGFTIAKGAVIENAIGGKGSDTLTGNEADNRLDGGIGSDTMSGGKGDDTFIVNASGDQVKEALNEGADKVETSAAISSAFSNVEDYTLTGAIAWAFTGNDLDNKITGNNAVNTLTGGKGADTLTGGDANDVLDGGLGDDILVGRKGDDIYVVDSLKDTVTEKADEGIDTVKTALLIADATNFTNIEKFTFTGTVDWTFTGNDLDNTITGGTGNDLLDGGKGKDTLIGGAGNDTYNLGDLSDTVTDSAGTNDTVVTTALITTAMTGIESYTYKGSADWDFTGDDLNNTLTGDTGSDHLIGGKGNDILDGGTGADKLEGGLGNDTFFIDDAGDSVVEAAAGGTDLVKTEIDINLLTDTGFKDQEIENLTLLDGATSGTGNKLANVITANNAGNALQGGEGNDTLIGGKGADTLDGGSGNDAMTGGGGDDTYLVDSLGDKVTEDLNQGTDTIESTVLLAAAVANVENYTYSGTAKWTFTGNTLDNVITAGSGDDTLGGAGGKDKFVGGDGSDTYLVDSLDDSVVEKSSEGSDTVKTTALIVDATNFANVEKFTFTGSGNWTFTGNGLDNTITGGAGNDILDGGKGADALIGGGGNDTYYLDDPNDSVVDSGGTNDMIVSTALITKAMVGIESYGYSGTGDWSFTGDDLNNTLDGDSGSDHLIGGKGNDILDGGTGADKLEGGLGNDTFFIDNAGDSVVETAAGGTDLVKTTVDINLQTNAGLKDQEIENVLLLTGAISVTGNALANVITGNDAGNTLHGGEGNDTLIGGTGKDQLFGDGGNDTLTGNDGDDTLDGGTGNDAMTGGKGNDTYVVDSLSDKVIEVAGQGDADEVQSSITYSLASLTTVEKLTLTGAAAINGTGNTLANTLTGNGADNVLDGGTGNDTFDGAAGNDTYIIDNLVEFGQITDSSGNDTIKSALKVTLTGATAGVETYINTGSQVWNVDFSAETGTAFKLVGGSAADILKGGSKGDTLDGGTGADQLSGGSGDDTYVVDNVGDKVTEVAGQGTADLVMSTVSYTLGAEVERLTLAGTGAINGTGNGGANTITGNDAANVLDGAGGGDAMAGGKGNDIYKIDDAGDTVTEANGAGTDTIQSLISIDLAGGSFAGEIENVTLLATGTGTSAAGNSFNNVIIGNDLGNTLSGGTGNDTLTGGLLGDTLDGGLGDDTMTGGKGDDFYLVDSLADKVIEAAVGGTDTVKSEISFSLAALSAVENLALTGPATHAASDTAKINGTGNALANTLTGNDGDNLLDGGTGIDSFVGGKGNDTFVLDNLAELGAGMIQDVAGSDTIKTALVLTNAGIGNVIGIVENYSNSGSAAWTLDLSGQTGISHKLVGGSGADVLTGADQSDVIEGGAGNDTINDADGGNTLDGGAGNDVITAGLGNDTITGGDGNDTINDSGGQNAIDGGKGNDNISVGGGANQALSGGDGDDSLLYTGTGDSEMLGGAGNDVLNGGLGQNKLDGGDGNDVLIGGGTNDQLIGGKGNDIFVINDIYDRVVEKAGEGTDSVRISSTASVFSLDLTGTHFAGQEIENVLINAATQGVTVIGNSLGNVMKAETAADGQGDDELHGGDGNDTLDGRSPDATKGDGNDKLYGEVGNDTLTGGDGNDLLDGGTGSDAMTGGKGNDVYVVDAAGDRITESAGQGDGDEVQSSIAFSLAGQSAIEKLTLIGAADIAGTGNALVNTLTGNDGTNLLDGGTGIDFFAGGKGDDTYILDNVAELDAAHVQEQAGQGSDTVRTALALTNANLIANVENYINTGSTAWTLDLSGDATHAHKLVGGSGKDSFIGGDQDDVLDGGTGADTLTGGIGADTFIIDNAADSITDLEALDTVLINRTINLATDAQFKGMTLENGGLTGTAALNITGTDNANILAGNDGANTVDGGKDADTMAGGKGNDVYKIDNAGDEVVEKAGEGTDAIQSLVDIDLTGAGFAGQEIENVTLLAAGTGQSVTGNDFNNVIVGNDLGNTLSGGKGNDTLTGGLLADTLDGGAGNDAMTGGKGDDTYIVDSAGDKVNESSGAGTGTDTVKSEITFSLAALTAVENLILTGPTTHQTTDKAAISGTGNALANTLTGNDGDNVLDGGSGIDILIGNDGNDTYVLDNVLELDAAHVQEAGGKGSDTIKTALQLTAFTGIAGIENYVNSGSTAWSLDLSGQTGLSHKLVGGSAADTLKGSTAADWLDGGTGADTLTGGAGGDTFVVDNVGDQITDAASDDLLMINRTVNLATDFGGVFLAAQLTGTSALNITGNGSSNELTGNDGANTLDGNGGNDTLSGLKGNDLYKVDAGDTVIESTGGGTDTVQSKDDVDLTGIHFQGEIENVTLLGGFAGDLVQGNDLANVIIGNDNDLTLFGGKGNDTLTGGAGDDYLDGGLDKDTMTGGKGDDAYAVDNAGDKVVETLSAAAGGGIDTVYADISFSLAALSFVEKLQLFGQTHAASDTDALNGTGNALDNEILGNDGVNILDGGAGNDTLSGGGGNDSLIGGTGIDKMSGGDGNDTYAVDNAGDTVLESGGEGTHDLINAGVSIDLAAGSFTGQEIEDVTLTGSSALNAAGNDLANILTGNSGINTLTGGKGDDRLDGGAGNDTLIGGEGNDTYVVDNAKDVTVEGAGLNSGDHDLVLSSVTHALADNVENLTLTGVAAINGTGNGADNIITGNDAKNLLSGGDGSDTLVGGKGDDVLTGGGGSDTFRYLDLADRGTGKETITDFDKTFGSSDILDVSALFTAVNKPTDAADAFASGFLKLDVVGLDTIVSIDIDGGSDGYVTLVTLVGVSVTASEDYAFQVT